MWTSKLANKTKYDKQKHMLKLLYLAHGPLVMLVDAILSKSMDFGGKAYFNFVPQSWASFKQKQLVVMNTLHTRNLKKPRQQNKLVPADGN